MGLSARKRVVNQLKAAINIDIVQYRRGVVNYNFAYVASRFYTIWIQIMSLFDKCVIMLVKKAFCGIIISFTCGGMLYDAIFDSVNNRR